MLSPVREKTSLSRVVSAILFAFAFPPVALVLLGVVMNLPNDMEKIPNLLSALPTALALSLLAGWIFVLPACVVWAVLSQFDRHYWLVAALVGVATGLAFASLLAAFGDDGSQVLGTPLVEMLLTCATLGAFTGLGVWWIAYGRQESLPRPIVTRPPLHL